MDLEDAKALDYLKEELTTPPVLAFPDFDSFFVVGTGVSSASLGFVLYQKKEYVKVHVVQCTSRAMTEQERRYTTRERGALAVLCAHKNFRVYRLSEKLFVIWTEHKALQTAFKQKDIHGRLAKWMDLMAEYDLDVRYWLGSANGVAYYSSRRLTVGQKHRAAGERNLTEELMATVCYADPKNRMVGATATG